MVCLADCGDQPFANALQCGGYDGRQSFPRAKCGAVINPDTPVENIKDVLPLCDMVLVMSVFPGFGGQKFIPECLDKLRELRGLIDGLGREILLEIDGGVHAGNVEEIKAAGADVIVAGSAVFNAENRAEMIAKLKA